MSDEINLSDGVNPKRLDATGKVVLDQIYNQETPLHYFRAIAELNYIIPQLAKPIFSALIDHLKQKQNISQIKLVDLGCSYGVNGALLKTNHDLTDLFERYQNTVSSTTSRNEMMQADRKWYDVKDQGLEVVGVDISNNALSYALEVGLIDSKLVGNFEIGDLSSAEMKQLETANMIVSTGCIGYVGKKTIAALLSAMTAKLPLMAHFVLRTFSFDDIAQFSRSLGYQIYQSKRAFHQRRFVSMEEQAQTLKRLKDMSIDTKGLEEDGWYYADLFLCLPPGMTFDTLPEQVRQQFPHPQYA